jgi:hypothetical protein
VLYRLFEAASEDVGVDGGKVGFTLLVLARSYGEWVGCIEFRRDVRDEVSGEWKEPVEDPTVQCTDESGNEVHVSR